MVKGIKKMYKNEEIQKKNKEIKQLDKILIGYLVFAKKIKWYRDIFDNKRQQHIFYLFIINFHSIHQSTSNTRSTWIHAWRTQKTFNEKNLDSIPTSPSSV